MWEKHSTLFDELITKIKRAKLMKFLTIEPKQFHPYLVADIYQRAVVAADEHSFSTKVHDTQFYISPQFLAEEFGLSNSGAVISTYKEGTLDIKKEHWNNGEYQNINPNSNWPPPKGL